MELSSGPQAHGPSLVRLLARIRGIDTPAPAQAVSGRLGQWIDWRHAVALASALDARAATGTDDAAVDDGADEFARVRTTLVGAIEGDRVFTAGAVDSAASDANAPLRDVPPLDAVLVRQRALALQQKMEAEVGHLRGRLRGRLMRRGGERSRLAAIDAVMERAIGPRERALLAPVPELLASRFERLREAAPAAPGDAAGAAPADWIAVFRREMRELLLAELALRLQPAQGLLAALRTTDADSDAR